MNFAEFYENVEKMKYELQEQFINADDVEIIHSKSSGKDLIWAQHGERIVSHFKW